MCSFFHEVLSHCYWFNILLRFSVNGIILVWVPYLQTIKIKKKKGKYSISSNLVFTQTLWVTDSRSEQLTALVPSSLWLEQSASFDELLTEASTTLELKADQNHAVVLSILTCCSYPRLRFLMGQGSSLHYLVQQGLGQGPLALSSFHNMKCNFQLAWWLFRYPQGCEQITSFPANPDEEINQLFWHHPKLFYNGTTLQSTVTSRGICRHSNTFYQLLQYLQIFLKWRSARMQTCSGSAAEVDIVSTETLMARSRCMQTRYISG